MKIDKTLPPLPASQIGELAPRSANARAGAGSTQSEATPSSTNVKLGTGAAQLRSLGENVASASAVNKAKVAEIKQAISEGRFKINDQAVADGLIDSVKEMISANTHKV